MEVYARENEAELLLNGESIGCKAIARNVRTKFRVPYEPGELTAVIRDADEWETARASLHSAGQETKLTLQPETETVRPNQLLYVRLRYTDEQSTVKPPAAGRNPRCCHRRQAASAGRHPAGRGCNAESTAVIGMETLTVPCTMETV